MTLDLICAEEAAKAETARLAAEQQEREAQGLQGPVQAGTGARAGAVALGQQREAQSGRTLFSMPPGEDLAANPEFALRAALWGIEVRAGRTPRRTTRSISRGVPPGVYQVQAGEG